MLACSLRNRTLEWMKWLKLHFHFSQSCLFSALCIGSNFCTEQLKSVFCSLVRVCILLYLVIYRVQQVQEFSETFQDGGRYHIETSPLICRSNQWTGFYMITASVLKELSKWFFISSSDTPHDLKLLSLLFLGLWKH